MDNDQLLTVQEGSTVLLDYTLSTESEIIESSHDTGPVEFVVGSGKIHPLIESQLIGRRLNEKVEVVLDPTVAFGEINPKLIIEVPKHRLPENIQNSDLGYYFEAKDFDGHLRRFRCVKREGAVLTFDGNHELAGLPLYLDATILKLL